MCKKALTKTVAARGNNQRAGDSGRPAGVSGQGISLPSFRAEIEQKEKGVLAGAENAPAVVQIFVFDSKP